MVLIICGVIVLAAVIQISAVVAIEYGQLRRNKAVLSSLKPAPADSKTLVVYYSRSGNTELMAYQIAAAKHARVLNIEAADYRIGYRGWFRAMLHAKKTRATITTDRIDLSRYDTVYIGAPIWLYSPAPPIFQFVRNNDFTGKKVVLFNSMNSKFEKEYIDSFSTLVQEQGGQMIRHMYVNRGRMTRQMNTKTFLDTVKRKIAE